MTDENNQPNKDADLTAVIDELYNLLDQAYDYDCIYNTQHENIEDNKLDLKSSLHEEYLRVLFEAKEILHRKMTHIGYDGHYDTKIENPEKNLREFYEFLAKKYTINEDNFKFDKCSDDLRKLSTDNPGLTNIELLKKHGTESSFSLVQRIAIIAATLLTGIIPGVVIGAVVYAATGRHVFESFNKPTRGAEAMNRLDEKAMKLAEKYDVFKEIYNKNKESMNSTKDEALTEQPKIK